LLNNVEQRSSYLRWLVVTADMYRSIAVARINGNFGFNLPGSAFSFACGAFFGSLSGRIWNLAGAAFGASLAFLRPTLRR
jgi:uncharacterized membrane protein YdjX (TVP38/TMEM64 family)